MTTDVAGLLDALSKAKTENPNLANLFELQSELLKVQATFTVDQPFSQNTGERVWRAKWPYGLRALGLNDLNVDWEAFGDLLTRVAAVIVKRYPEAAETAKTLAGSEIENRKYEAQVWFDRLEQDAVVSGLVAAAMQPWLSRAAELVSEHFSDDAWHNGTCPVCGGWPDIALIVAETGARQLCCSRCDFSWVYNRLGCPFCGNENPNSLTYYAGNDETYRLYVCDACQSYLKAVDLRRTDKEIILPIERVLTTNLDSIATRMSYSPNPIAKMPGL